MSRATKYDMNQLMEEWRINGFVVFADLIPTEKIDRIREAWAPIRDREDRDIERQGKYPSRGYHRYNVRVPFEQPFVDEDLFEHPALVEFLERVMGPDYVWTHFDSNIPLPGTDYQKWHRDGMASPFPGIMTLAFCVGVKFPLVDTSEENGSFEVILGTQYVTNDELPPNLDDVFGTNTAQQIPPNSSQSQEGVALGSGWTRFSSRHSQSDHARDELCMAFSVPWLFSRWLHEYTEKHFPRDLWESLSPHTKHMLRWQRVKDAC